MGNYFDTLSEKERKVAMSCLNKFFYKKIPELVKISNTKRFRWLCGGDIKSLGAEGAYEAFLGLFDDGTLKLVFDNIEQFAIWTEVDNGILVIYDSMEEALWLPKP